LPNPHPVGLQSRCSLLLASLPFRLLQATAPHRTHAWHDPGLSDPARSMHHGDSCPSAAPASSPEPDPHNAGIPTPWPGGTPGQSRSNSSVGYPSAHSPSGPAEPQLCVGQLDPCPSDSPPIRPCQAPALCGVTGAPPQPGVRQPHQTARQEPHPLGRADPSSKGFPDNRSTRLPCRPPPEDSNRAQETHRL
jgi:hypothetical protein